MTVLVLPPKKQPAPAPPPSSPIVPIVPGAQASGGGVPVPGFVPPNGFAGFAQQTPAVQSLYGGRRRSGRRKRRGSKKKAAGVRRVARKARSAGGRLKKGSAAAKARMAKLRKMRRK